MFGERINQCSHLFDLWELIQLTLSFFPLTSQVVSVVKNLPANAGGVRNTGSIQGSGRFPGGGNENLFQYSCLKNPMDREAWWATVQRVAKSQTRLKRLRLHARMSSNFTHFNFNSLPLGLLRVKMKNASSGTFLIMSLLFKNANFLDSRRISTSCVT